MAVRVNPENFAQEVLEADGIVLTDFYSDSCLPCKRLSPVLAELEETQDIKLAKINIAYVQAAPTLIAFKNGKEAGRLRGAVKKDEIISLLNSIH